MSFWQIFGKSAVSDQGETIQRMGDSTSVSSKGTVFSHMGSTTVGSDGSVFNQMGSFSSDGSARMGNSATGLGAVFNKSDWDQFGCRYSMQIWITYWWTSLLGLQESLRLFKLSTKTDWTKYQASLVSWIPCPTKPGFQLWQGVTNTVRIFIINTCYWRKM